MQRHFLDGKVVLHPGDCREVLASLPEASVDAIVCDPPYGLEFMGKDWDAPWKQGFTKSPAGNYPDPSGQHRRNPSCANCRQPARGKNKCQCGAPSFDYSGDQAASRQKMTAFQAFMHEVFSEAIRVLRPGGHLVAFSGTRTYHRMACAIEDAGFEIRDQLAYCYGSGFPKSHNITKAAGEAVCRCSASDDQLRGVRQGEDDAGRMVQEGEPPDLLSAMQRSSARAGMGHARAQGREGAEDVYSIARSGEQGMERRRDAPQEAGQLRQRPLRAVPAGSYADGPHGRIRNGAPSGDGAVGGPSADAAGVRASSGSQPAEQRPEQSGALAVQPNAQTRGAWPACGRCGKPVVPDGLGTALKPAWEPICLARKPLIGTVAANVLAHGTGALNIDGCRVGTEVVSTHSRGTNGAFPKRPGEKSAEESGRRQDQRVGLDHSGRLGRWPANVIHDGSEDVVAFFPSDAGASAPVRGTEASVASGGNITGERARVPGAFHSDDGSAARFFASFHHDSSPLNLDSPPLTTKSEESLTKGDEFMRRLWYGAKADGEDRLGSKHPTVKPVDLMQWLVRLVTPKGGVVLDPFAGTGTTGEAAWREGMRAILIEREPEYQDDIARRMDLAAKPTKRAAVAKSKNNLENPEDLPLFGRL